MCKHNDRTRYTTGFHCNDCNTFFSKNSPTYRSDELLSTIWMVLWNINVERRRAKQDISSKITTMLDKIGIGIKHNNYEELITEATFIMNRFGKNSESANITLR